MDDSFDGSQYGASGGDAPPFSQRAALAIEAPPPLPLGGAPAPVAPALGLLLLTAAEGSGVQGASIHWGHPERPQRLEAVMSAVRALPNVVTHAVARSFRALPVPASLTHTAPYLENFVLAQRRT